MVGTGGATAAWQVPGSRVIPQKQPFLLVLAPGARLPAAQVVCCVLHPVSAGKGARGVGGEAERLFCALAQPAPRARGLRRIPKNSSVCPRPFAAVLKKHISLPRFNMGQLWRCAANIISRTSKKDPSKINEHSQRTGAKPRRGAQAGITLP
ncbi:hypothetical protein NDU88_012225 [Pleurodeles waltl]|uniref:Uncharacterized protein n=1 Tax=Pleurodeles waltl TaxID=8319 RepID=A0AAV7R299_PLEWA|nr:hypothetical protein NDU88_012225 [Pleurodeles waltl]